MGEDDRGEAPFFISPRKWESVPEKYKDWLKDFDQHQLLMEVTKKGFKARFPWEVKE